MFKLSTSLFLSLLFLGAGQFARAQSQEQMMNQMLDVIDKPQAWQRTPVSSGGQGQTFPQPKPNYNQRGYLPNRSQGQYGRGGGPFMGGQPIPGLNPASTAGAGGSPSPFGQLFTKQNMMQAFFGSGPSSGGTGVDPNAVGNAQSNLQTALNEAAKAESDESRAHYGDRNSRQSAASSAQYHANYARAAADRAYSASYNGTSLAKDYAAQARNAANRAQSAADRASYNASQASD